MARSPTVKDAAAFAGGAAVGTSASVAMGYLATRALSVGARLSPAFARATAVVLSAPVVLGATGAGGVYGGVKSAMAGNSPAKIALDTLGGAASLGTNIIGDVIAATPAFAAGEKKKKADKEEKAAVDLEKKTLAADKAFNKLNKVDGTEAKKKKEAAAEAAPAAPVPTPAQPTTAFDKRRDANRLEQESLREAMKKEQASGGYGPKSEKITNRLKELQAEARTIDADEAKAPSSEKTAFALGLSVGAVVGGGVAGYLMAMPTKAAAKAATEATAKGVESVAKTAGRLIGASKKGVIAGTIEGDKAAAAIEVAKQKLAAPAVSNLAAFGVPAVNAAHGAGMIVLSEYQDDPTTKNLMRFEGTAAIVASVVGAKLGLMARAMRPVISPQAATKIETLSQRLTRERVSGPAGVAQAKGQRQVENAQRLSKVAAAKTDGAVTVAQNKAARAGNDAAAQKEVAAAKDKGRISAAKANARETGSRARASEAVATIQNKADQDLARLTRRTDVSAARGELTRQAAERHGQTMLNAHADLAPHMNAASARPMKMRSPHDARENAGWSQEARMASARARGVAMPGTGGGRKSEGPM